MEVKIKNDDIFIRFDEDSHWTNIGSYRLSSLKPVTSYSPNYDISGYYTCANMSTQCAKFKPTTLREESTVKEVKLKGIDIELDAIL